MAQVHKAKMFSEMLKGKENFKIKIYYIVGLMYDNFILRLSVEKEVKKMSRYRKLSRDLLLYLEFMGVELKTNLLKCEVLSFYAKATVQKKEN